MVRSISVLAFFAPEEEWDSTQHPLRDEEVCGGDWTPLGLYVPESIGDVPFRRMATLEIRPGEPLIENGFKFPEISRMLAKVGS